VLHSLLPPLSDSRLSSIAVFIHWAVAVSACGNIFGEHFKMGLSRTDSFVVFMLFLAFVLIFLLNYLYESTQDLAEEAYVRVLALEGKQRFFEEASEAEIYNCWLSLKQARESKWGEEKVSERDRLTSSTAFTTYGGIHTCGYGSIPRSPGA
jgi:hypothetical protein